MTHVSYQCLYWNRSFCWLFIQSQIQMTYTNVVIKHPQHRLPVYLSGGSCISIAVYMCSHSILHDTVIHSYNPFCWINFITSLQRSEKCQILPVSERWPELYDHLAVYKNGFTTRHTYYTLSDRGAMKWSNWLMYNYGYNSVFDTGTGRYLNKNDIKITQHTMRYWFLIAWGGCLIPGDLLRNVSKAISTRHNSNRMRISHIILTYSTARNLHFNKAHIKYMLTKVLIKMAV